MAEAKIASQRHSGRTKARHQGCKDIFKRCIRSRNKVLPELARKELDPFVWTDFLRRQLESCGGALTTVTIAEDPFRLWVVGGIAENEIEVALIFTRWLQAETQKSK